MPSSGIRSSTATTDTLYGYDTQDRLASVTEAKQNGSAPTVATGGQVYAPFDASGHALTGSTLPTVLYQYDAAGNLHKVLYPNGTETDYTYSPATDEETVTNRLSAVSGTAGELSYDDYHLDADGRKTSDAETKYSAGSAFSTIQITWTYDALSRLLSEVYADSQHAADGYTTRYAYDLANNRVEKTVDSGSNGTIDESVAYNYVNPANGKSGNNELYSTVSTVNGTATFGYDANGSMTTQVVMKIVKSRRSADKRLRITSAAACDLESGNGVEVGPVRPTPVFHGTKVQMRGGYKRTRDIKLWNENDRLRIHLAQFQKTTGRTPTSGELVDIMLSRANLPGLEDQDQFEIRDLAQSIAINGVRKPPIVDTDGTLLDGNRRVAACQYLLDSPDFTSEQKKRAESIYVWQLTEHATNDERNAVVVSLNFEKDCKQEWPPYVKARRVFEAFQEMVALEGRKPGPVRTAELKKELAGQFGYGHDTTHVSRYINMIQFATEFEDYQIATKKKDRFEVQHSAARYFEYFEEMGKGGVGEVLRTDDNFRNLVFDLLFEGKISNWNKIRELRFVHQNDEAVQELHKARDINDRGDAQAQVDRAIDVARVRRTESRSVGANTRIEIFVKWLNDMPLSAFRDQVTADNLSALLRALKLVEGHAKAILGSAAR